MMKLFPSGRIVVSTLLFSVGVRGGAAEPDKVEELPAMKVAANTPLVKVAEYKMLEPRAATAVVARGDYLYVVSGMNSRNAPSYTVERFDTRSGKSEIFAKLRNPRLWHRAVLVGDKLYVLGGAEIDEISSSDLAATAGTMRAVARSKSGLGGLDDGRDINTIDRASNIGRARLAWIDSVEIINLTTGKVSAGPDMRTPRGQFVAVATGDRILAMGGNDSAENRTSLTNGIDVLDLKTNKWSRGGAMGTGARNGDGVLVEGGFVVVAGGYNGRLPQSDVTAYNVRTQAWNAVAPLCRPASAHATVFLGHYLFLFGDYAKPEEFLAYDLKTKQSETFTGGFAPTCFAAAVAGEDGRIYVVGGQANQYSKPMDLVQVFELTKTGRGGAEK